MRAVFTMVVVLVVLGANVTAVSADDLETPFGIERGQKLSTLNRAGSGSVDNDYTLKSVPKPHPMLSRYVVRATVRAGVCAVKGYAPVGEPSSMDRTLNAIRKQISELLGDPRFLPGNNDPANTGIWVWMGSERTPSAGRSALETVALYRFETADGRKGAMLEFEFKNREECAGASMPTGLR